MNLLKRWVYYTKDLRKHKNKERYQEMHYTYKNNLFKNKYWCDISKEAFYIKYTKSIKRQELNDIIKLENEIKQHKEYIKSINYLKKVNKLL